MYIIVDENLNVLAKTTVSSTTVFTTSNPFVFSLKTGGFVITLEIL